MKTGFRVGSENLWEITPVRFGKTRLDKKVDVKLLYLFNTFNSIESLKRWLIKRRLF